MFLWCHVRHINPSKEHPERITKKDKKLVKHITNPEKITQEDNGICSDLDYDQTKFPMQEKGFSKIEKRTIFVLMCLVLKMDLHFRSKT